MIANIIVITREKFSTFHTTLGLPLTLTIISFQRLLKCFRSNFDGGSGKSLQEVNSQGHTIHFLHRMWHRVPHSMQAFEGVESKVKQKV